MKKIALLFAGQGSQTVGMGADLPEVVALFSEADKALNITLSKRVFEGSIEELTRTANCQPALYVHGLGCLAALELRLGQPIPFAGAAGLSLGEFTAHAAAGTFDFQTGLRIVAQRGLFMDEACAATDGTMVAMVGGEFEVVEEIARSSDVDIANINAPGQVVLSGTRCGIASAIAKAKEAGVRKVVPLTVAGAYHSRLMRSAAEKLADEIRTLTLKLPRFPVPSNYLGHPAETPEKIRQSLVDQVTGSVRWVDCMKWFAERGIEHFIELGPGGVLASLMARIDKKAKVVSITDAQSLENALRALSEWF